MLRCIITSIGSIMIGQVEMEDENKIILTDPREVQIIQVAQNQTKFAVLHIFGRPKIVTVHLKSIMLSYDLEDPNVISIYEEHCSNIRRAKPGEVEELINKNRH